MFLAGLKKCLTCGQFARAAERQRDGIGIVVDGVAIAVFQSYLDGWERGVSRSVARLLGEDQFETGCLVRTDIDLAIHRSSIAASVGGNPGGNFRDITRSKCRAVWARFNRVKGPP